MNHHFLVMIMLLVITVVAGCGQPTAEDGRVQAGDSERPLDTATINAGLDPTDQRILALVSWFKRKGVTIEYIEQAEGHGNWWRITQPKISGEYDVTFSIRTFPVWASEHQMRHAINSINLAYILNAPAHLAMSYGGFAAATPDAIPKSDDELPKLNGLPVTQAIQQLFKKYEAG